MLADGLPWAVILLSFIYVSVTHISVYIATHYHFLQEIPRFVGYEIKLSIGAWDHKWVSDWRLASAERLSSLSYKVVSCVPIHVSLAETARALLV